MTRPTFAEALADEAPKIAAWELSPTHERATVSVFTLRGGGAVQMAWRTCSPGEVPAITSELELAGHRLGHYDEHCDLVWIADGQGVTVWSATARILVADESSLRLGDEREHRRDAFEAFQSFVDEELYIDRGVRGRLAGGALVELVYEPKWSAGGNPTYSRNDLICETGWTGAIAGALARWAGVGYESWLEASW